MNSNSSTSVETMAPAANGNGLTHRSPVAANGKANGNGNGIKAAPETPSPSEKPPDGGREGLADEVRRQAVRDKYRHVRAVHVQSKPSCLSTDTTETPNFIGFRNLMGIVLVSTNLRLVIENIQKYGVLVCFKCHDFRKSDVQLGLALYFLIPCHLLLAYFLERTAASNARRSPTRSAARRDGRTSPTKEQALEFRRIWRRLLVAHAVNVSAILVLTTYVVYAYIHHPMIGTVVEVHAIIVWLKTASYALTNRDLRHAYLHPVRGELDALPAIYRECPYPQNVTFSNLVYFWFAPTLVYQPAYPRTERIRWSFVMKRAVEIVCLGAFMWLAAAQYATPLLHNSLDKMATLDVMSIAERLLKLSTVSLLIWLAGFFALFQSFLNLEAELTRFGDREFYEAWWNSGSLGEYWRTWNKPVYSFLRQHVYSPLRGRGWSHQGASIAVFFLSAVLHEMMVGIPTHNVI
ncbi:MBOAT, membrane-bound O-acyltransferase family-domain-containing protein, partial [Staphylotrichum tortipilum]